MLVLNKPYGLAVQGGSGTTRHVDGLLEALRDEEGQKPRLVHRLDKDTAGCLVVAKTRFAAMTLAKTFRSRSARKIYWALVAGVPRVKQGRVSTYLAKEEGGEGDARMRVARHGDEGASHALTYYAVVEAPAQKLAWLSLKPVTGRTHQLRAHAAHIGHPIVGDPKYFDVENWELPGGLQNRLHLVARRIVCPHPRTGKPIDVTAPLPPHMAAVLESARASTRPATTRSARRRRSRRPPPQPSFSAGAPDQVRGKLRGKPRTPGALAPFPTRRFSGERSRIAACAASGMTRGGSGSARSAARG